MLIKVTVVARAKKASIIVLGNNHLKVRIPAAPVKGKANEQLIEMLADYYRVRKSAVRIKTGMRTRDKVIEIIGVDP